MKSKIINFIKSPWLSAVLVIICLTVVMWAVSNKKQAKSLGGVTAPMTAEVQPSSSSQEESSSGDPSVSSTQTKSKNTKGSSSTTTTAVSASSEESTTVPYGTQAPVTKPPMMEGGHEPTSKTTAPSGENNQPGQETPAETTTTAATEKPHAPSTSSNYTPTGVSPNSDFYQSRLAVAGDSIAYGYNVYGLIPNEHNIARESVSLWNLDYFTFNYGYGEIGMIDAIDYVHPKLLLMSMGMNDVNMSTADSFAMKYNSLVNQVLERVPDTNIVICGITPVGAYTGFTTNETIMSFNSALRDMVDKMNNDRVYFFDPYSVLANEYSTLRDDCSGGDGIHLQSHCYTDILTAIFSYLDTTPVKEHIEASE